MDITYVLSVILGFVGIFLLGLTYTYIDKLEKTGCACSEHKYRNFIKRYCIFAIVVLAFMILVPATLVTKMFGPIGSIILSSLQIAYGILTVVFFVLAIIYVRYLIKEKCKCSEDKRREILYYWSILEIVLIAVAILVPILMWAKAGASAVASSAVKEGSKYATNVMEAAVNPVKSVRKVPENVKKSIKLLRK